LPLEPSSTSSSTSPTPERLRPGNTVGQVFAAHAEVLTKAGYAGHFLKACPDASPTVRS